jgi:hypothetical protein
METSALLTARGIRRWQDSPLTDADGAKEPIRYIVIEMTPVTRR